ncbi:GNAT family N-acetyltransferase [Ktedonosporobacter rubrisoli]|uniref:GNAT family N-acetyltransferase n=1 Tax=Ktedonosporobacter rubrisoli TaxID=2509675 RepID=A0A4P6K4K3_KTERU|nr:GNAT family N-acetyltransferase [Ktedonosporobacter rubrisoli]QBD83257.1 GNAT family N-acetyltransferase [Ktedonosporobacter rubrisoli]
MSKDYISTATSTLQLIENHPEKDSRWERFIDSHQDGLIYHHPAWLGVLEEAFGYRSAHLACQDANGQFRGIFPLYKMQGILGTCRFSSLPRTPVAGPLARDRQALEFLIHAALGQLKATPRSGLQIKMLSNELDDLGIELTGVKWRDTYQLELPARPELLRFGNSRNHAQIKRAVHKAYKHGISLERAETKRELRAWYELYLSTMRQVVIPPRPYRFFEIAWERLQPRGLLRLLLAHHHEAGKAKPVAGLLLLMAGRTVFYAFSGWHRNAQELRPNDALHWQAIHDACSEGFRYYDFGEVPANTPGLAEFKSKWGTQKECLYRYYYPSPRESAINLLEADTPFHRAARTTWRRLPLEATELLGTLAHHIF